MGAGETDPITQLSLPPGFRFYPTDEELLVQYLCRQVAGHQFSLQIIGEIDLYKFDPWILPSKAIFGEKEWYFFSPRDRKYPNGSRPNRVAGSGYWKATGTDKIITTEGRKAGIKKSLVFYVGKAPKGTKTNWIMHEYRLIESSGCPGSSKLDEWVLCRIYMKNYSSYQKPTATDSSKEQISNCSLSSSSISQHLENVLDSLPEIDDQFLSLPRVNSLKTLLHQDDQKRSFQRMDSGNFDWAVSHCFSAGPTGINNDNSVPELGQFNQTHNKLVPSYMNFPPIPPLQSVDSPSDHQKFRNSVDDHEVQSGIFFQQNAAGLRRNSFNNSVDQYGIGYRGNLVGSGLGSEGKRDLDRHVGY